jgi:hypothetical protein
MDKSIKTQKLRTTKGNNNNKDANKCFKKTKQDVFQMKISSRNCIVLNVFRQKKKKRERGRRRCSFGIRILSRPKHGKKEKD